jgi:hypothetical protein
MAGDLALATKPPRVRLEMQVEPEEARPICPIQHSL